MANPRKCTLGKAETKYLEFLVGQDHIWPFADKVEIIPPYPEQETYLAFLGLAS